MSSCLPINVADLLYLRGVEAPRVEFKGSWNEGPTAQQVLQTICAFANDLHNLNGGYIIIGVEERDGTAILPPCGLEPRDLETIQRWIRGNCRRLEPEYQPIQSPEVIEGKHILVLWTPASEVRPHAAPSSRSGKDRKHFVRLGAETVAAQGQLLTDLLRMTARVPFDDRRAGRFTLNDLRATLVREFLGEIRSALLAERDDAEIYRRMLITARFNGSEVPRNVALLFFSDDPELAFPGARIEVVHFADGGDVLEERVFCGPLHHQIRNCLNFLRSNSSTHIRKRPDRPETTNWMDYPSGALEEALVNAAYHRSYEAMPEPTKVYLYHDRLTITSYPGPLPGMDTKQFRPGRQRPLVPARNRRIGEFFKELRLAEARGTGVRKIFTAMAENGSPPPRFEFGEDRSYFTVVLPIHPGLGIRPSQRREADPPAAPAAGFELVDEGGAMRPDSPFYVERQADERLGKQIAGRGTTTLVTGPRQCGKSSLLARALRAARARGTMTFFLDFRLVDPKHLESLESLL
ncbi:MAG: hypothetical protein GY842_20180, partial [bacterium]|nr:hypothetical protein [bacterium]